MSRLICLVLFLCLLPFAVPLYCFTCVFPTISPLDCIKYPQKCPPGQLCLSSAAVGKRGDFRVVLYEKSCILSSLCGISGEKYAMGINFTFTNECCSTNLCNGATSNAASIWTGYPFHLLLSFSCILVMDSKVLS
ncbi:sperm acrosome membrane-associated protein 4-like [Conger conger]|uniref:sperm acrosome membrane-associated protein 4-like n=1 Tax=Conger conger TaxID=82655 RepID=UPI002A59E531|nr:sperm acrosome membrane-associated protein 4-like [Conger conger]